MPTIKERLHFNFGGVDSKTLGLINVVLDNGMYEETFVAERELNETKIRGNNRPMLHSIEDSPLEFDMTIAFETKFTDESLDKVIRWLFVDHYRPLFFEEKPEKVFMAMAIGSSQIVHNGMQEGYFTIKMRCDSSNVYSPKILSPTVTVATTNTIEITSNSHFDIYPEISILKSGAGKIVIESLDDGNNIFEIRDLTHMEDIYLNCEKEIIQTDILGVYRYDKIIGDFPRLVFGKNRMKITGACTIQFRYKNKYRF